MDFAALLNMAAQNAGNASKTVADLDSKETQRNQERIRQFREEQMQKKAKMASKRELIPEKKFTIPKRKSDEVSADSPKNKIPKKDDKGTTTIKKIQSGQIVASKGALQKGNKKPQTTEKPKIPPGTTKRPPPLDFGALMKAAVNNSEGKFDLNTIDKPLATPRRQKLSAHPKLSSNSVRGVSSGQLKKKEVDHMGRKSSVLNSKPIIGQNMVQTTMWGYLASKHEKKQQKRKEVEKDESECDDDDYDSDFIDDSEENFDKDGRKELENTLKMVNPKYNKDLWKKRERMINERDMVSNYRTIAKEEAMSARLGVMEDRVEAMKNGSVAL